MPTRLLLDGDDLPTLMLRIKEEMGPHARVVKAERIRTGGIAGFFAREHYELTVEVPDVPPAPVRERRPVAPAASGLDALMAAADAADAAHGSGAAPGGDAGVAEAGDAAAAAGPPVSTASQSFAEVLASVRAMVGQGETAGVSVAAVPTEAAAAAAGAVPAPAPFEFPRLDREAVAPPEPDAPAPDDAAHDAEAAAEDAAPAAADPTEPVEARSAPAAGVDAGRSRAATAADLLELGVPVRLLEGFASLTDPVPLSILVRRFERPPAVRLEPAVTVAVVGRGDLALRTAIQMAGRAGLDPRDVILAGDIESIAGHGRRVLTVAAASRHHARRRTDVPSVVALGVGDGPAAWAEGAALLAALGPEQAWGVVDARLRAAEVRRWVRAVGAQQPLDALAVVGTAEAQAPGVVLDVGTPVGWLDGLPATPLVWAALLSERLAEDADWD